MVSENICFDKVGIIIGCLLISAAIIYYYIYTKHNQQIQSQIQSRRQVSEQSIPSFRMESEDITPVVMREDYKTIYDPLFEPSRRPSLDQIPPPYFSKFINIRTRPYYDIPSVMGVLVSIKNDKEILQLFGSKDEINNYRYNYYAINKDGIKLDVNTNRNTLELNDGDIVRVLNEEYKVTLYNNKYYRYTPNMLYY